MTNLTSERSGTLAFNVGEVGHPNHWLRAILPVWPGVGQLVGLSLLARSRPSSRRGGGPG